MEGSPRHFQLNGKFLAAAPTGVHRVAMELGNALAGLIAEGHPAAAGLSLEALAPHDGMAQARSLAMPVRRLGPLRHIAWEQLVLPLHHGSGTLLNLCNIGPVLARDAVTMIHDAQVLLSPASYRPAFRWWYRLVQPRLARRHRLLLTVSEYSRGQLAAAGLAPAQRIAVVHNGVDHVLRQPACRAVLARLGLAGRTPDDNAGGNTGGQAQPFVLALANTQEHKNIALLLRAFSRPDMAGLRLVLFGGAGRADFESLGHRVPASVLFAGKVNDAELRALMEGALALAFPSTTEGFGLPPLEAMLLGCPAVIAPCGALPEVCGDAALRASEHDPAAWAGTLLALRDRPDKREAWVARGHARAASYTWRAAALVLAGVLGRLDGLEGQGASAAGLGPIRG